MSICFVTDLHLGRDAGNAWAEPVCTLPPSELIQRLKHVLIADRVDCLVLGGDLIEHGDVGRIHAVANLFRLIYLPTLICFGNHDLVDPDARAHWQAVLSRWPQAMLADALVDAGEMQVIGMNTHWLVNHQVRDAWQPGVPCLPILTESQRVWLRETVDTLSKPTILALHAPVHAVAMQEPHDGQVAHQTIAYRNAIEAELARMSRGQLVKAIVGGHVHFASIARHAQRYLITSSAVGESPACVRLLRWENEVLQIKNVALAPDDA